MAEWSWSEAELEAEIEAAMRAGAVAAAVAPRAKAVRYAPTPAAIVVELTSGATLSVPVRRIEGLAGAATDELARGTVVPGGEAVRWDGLDVDLSVPGLLAGVFGSPRWMRGLSEHAA